MTYSFRNLEVWQKAVQLSVQVYKITSQFKDYWFRDQITRSSLSVPSNIAEGYSRQTEKETIQFLFIARGSCSELETQILIGIKIGYLTEQKWDELIEKSLEIARMLYGLIQNKKSKLR